MVGAVSGLLFFQQADGDANNKVGGGGGSGDRTGPGAVSVKS